MNRFRREQSERGGFGPPSLFVAIPLTFYQLTSCSKYCLTRATRCIVPEGGALFLGTAIAPPSFDIARYSNPKARTFAPRESPRAGFFCQKQMRSPSHPSLSKVAPLDSESAGDLLVVEHMRLLGRFAHLFDRDRIEIGEEGFAGSAHGRIDDPLKQHRVCVEIFRIGGAQRHRGAHDLANSDAPALARQLIAASRPAHALEDLGVNQPLEQCLQVAGRQFVTRSQSFGRDRSRPGVQRDIDNSGDGENAPSRQ